MKYIAFSSILLLAVVASACSGSHPSTANGPAAETSTPSTAQATPTTKETETVISGETPVAVTWKRCVPDGTFPSDTHAGNTDTEGCRHHENNNVTV